MKKYVKEYKGHKVPEGAAHYLDGNRFFYNADKVLCFDTKRPQEGWRKTIFHGIASEATPLPEAPQEWMPAVGDECECLDRLLAHPRYCFAKVKAFYNGQVWLTSEAGVDLVLNIRDVKFRPLKTQQEKGREAFIEAAKICTEGTLLDNDDPEVVAFIENLISAEFTAPKAAK